MDLLACGMEALRNEALLLLVGLCSGCEEVAKIAAFEGAFERLLALVREEGGPAAGGVLVQDALELMNNLLRDSPANQRLFREMGYAAALPGLLHYEPQAATPGGAVAAAGFVEAAAAAAAAAAANGPASGLAANAAAAASGAAAAAAAASVASMAPQAAANFLVALETARLLLVAPSADDPAARSQQAAHRAAGQDALSAAGLGTPLLVLALDGGGAPSSGVRAQALLCLGDLVASNPRNQADLGRAAVSVRLAVPAAAGGGPASPPAASQRTGSYLPAAPHLPWGSPQKPQWQQLGALHAALRTALTAPSVQEAAAATHTVGAFCDGNAEGQVSMAATFAVAGGGGVESFGHELWSALIGSSEGPHAAASSRLPPFASTQRAALVLQHIIGGNVAAKERLAAAVGGGEAVVGT